jgi:hypothetical protein
VTTLCTGDGGQIACHRQPGQEASGVDLVKRLRYTAPLCGAAGGLPGEEGT